MSDLTTLSLELLPADNLRLANVCGTCDSHLRQIEAHMSVDIARASYVFQITGQTKAAQLARDLLNRLYDKAQHTVLTPSQLHLFLQDSALALTNEKPISHTIVTPRLTLTSRGANQAEYLAKMQTMDLTFGIGPAGTGKTYLAVAYAVRALVNHQIERIILTRPAVESGERLGFLPGDFSQKVDPYLRPLYDALTDMLGAGHLAKYIEQNHIDIAPLAYMRGRTFNNAFIILDEAQNTTPEQMKMFLTRIGFGTQVVVTGDITQVDLPKHQTSGLSHALSVLQSVKSIASVYFRSEDIVRHRLVKAIVNAYALYEAKAQQDASA